MTSTPRILVTLLAATAVALTAGCADSTAGGAGSGPSRHRTDPATLPASQIVYQTGSDGGAFTPSDYRAATLPELTNYANGDVYESDPPGLSASPGQPWTVQLGRVAPNRLARLLAAADGSGLFDKADYGMPGITDVGGTFVRIRPSRAPAQHVDVYALYYSEGDQSLSSAQRANRSELRKLNARFAHAVELLVGPMWQPTRVAVVQRAVTGSSDPVGSADPTPATTWPGPAPRRLLTHDSYDGRCGIVRGSAAKSLYAAARAHKSTHWTFHGKDVYLLVRAVLPGTTACPS
jgi:hypothetical protein